MRVRKKNKKILSIYIMMTTITFVFSSPVWAQNFAGTYPPPLTNDQSNLEQDDGVIENLYLTDDLLNDGMEEFEGMETLEADPEMPTVQLIPEQTVPIDAPRFTTGQDFPDESKYTIGKSDVINIMVMRHPEVSGDFMINNEGKIQYEFVGDLYVEGMTKEELKNVLQSKLSEFIISPELTVKIVGYNSKIVYVIGEVGRPGKIFMRGDTITVREALVQAGLPLLSAKTTKSQLITPSEDGKPLRKRVNIHKLLYEGDLRENLVMKPGDTLYVPPTVMAKAMRILQPVAQPVGTASGLGRTVTTGF